MTEAHLGFESYKSVRNDTGRNDRFRYAKVVRDNQPFFLKQALFPTGAGHLRRELVWYDFIHFVTEQYPALDLRPLRYVSLEAEDTFVSEWLDAPLVSLPHDAVGWKKNLKRYTDMLIAFDRAGESYSVPPSLRTYEPRNPRERLDVWIRDVVETDLLSRAHELLVLHIDGLRTSMQHGDLTPWQIINDDGTWVVIDGEKSGDDLFRFNDVAYSYGRLATRCNDEEAAETLLSRFVSERQLPASTIETQVVPVIVYRLLGMLGDAAEDENNQEYQNVERILAKVIQKAE